MSQNTAPKGKIPKGRNSEQSIKIRTRQLRHIMKLRLNLLAKDIGREKKELATRAIDELSLPQLEKIRNVEHNIANEILATFENKIAITEK